LNDLVRHINTCRGDKGTLINLPTAPENITYVNIDSPEVIAAKAAAEEEATRKAAKEEATRKAAEEEAATKAAEEEATRKAAATLFTGAGTTPAIVDPAAAAAPVPAAAAAAAAAPLPTTTPAPVSPVALAAPVAAASDPTKESEKRLADFVKLTEPADGTDVAQYEPFQPLDVRFGL
jgi:hypothetical protein